MIRSSFYKKTAYLFLALSIAMVQVTKPLPNGTNDPSAGLSLWNKCTRSINTYFFKPLDQYIAKPSVKYHIPDIIGIGSSAAFIGLACWIESGCGKPNTFAWPNIAAIAAGLMGTVAGLYGIGDVLWPTMKSCWRRQLGMCRADSNTWRIKPTELCTLDVFAGKDELKSKVQPLIEAIKDYSQDSKHLNSLEHNYVFYGSADHARFSRRCFIGMAMGSIISANPSFHAIEVPESAFDYNAAYIMELLNLRAPCVAFVFAHNDEYRKQGTIIDLMELINARKNDPTKQPIILFVSAEIGPVNTHITKRPSFNAIVSSHDDLMAH